MTLSADNIDPEYFMEQRRGTSEMGSLTHMSSGSSRKPPQAAGQGHAEQKAGFPSQLSGVSWHWHVVYTTTAPHLLSNGSVQMLHIYYLYQVAITMSIPH